MIYHVRLYYVLPNRENAAFYPIVSIRCFELSMAPKIQRCALRSTVLATGLAGGDSEVTKATVSLRPVMLKIK